MDKQKKLALAKREKEFDALIDIGFDDKIKIHQIVYDSDNTLFNILFFFRDIEFILDKSIDVCRENEIPSEYSNFKNEIEQVVMKYRAMVSIEIADRMQSLMF